MKMPMKMRMIDDDDDDDDDIFCMKTHGDYWGAPIFGNVFFLVFIFGFVRFLSLSLRVNILVGSVFRWIINSRAPKTEINSQTS